VTFDARWIHEGRGHEDFRYVATVHHEAIDGVPDTHPDCDVCRVRRSWSRIRDGKNQRQRLRQSGESRLFGGDVLTDVFSKTL